MQKPAPFRIFILQSPGIGELITYVKLHDKSESQPVEKISAVRLYEAVANKDPFLKSVRPLTNETMKSQLSNRSRSFHFFLGCCLAITGAFSSCGESGNPPEQTNAAPENTAPGQKAVAGSQPEYKEGSDYLLFERVRMLDKVGFTQPQEAYSVLLPKGWQHEGEVVWNGPETSCSGTFRWLKAQSGDGQYSIELLPDIVYSWNTNTELMQMNRSIGNASPYCLIGEPMDAEQYLRQVLAPEELGNPEILKVEPNPLVVEQMQQLNEENKRELMQYGAGEVQFHQTAINAQVRWKDGKEGWVVFGVSTIENVVPNYYNGSYDKIYTTQIAKRVVYKYPSGNKETSDNQFGVIMASFRTNPAWNGAVTQFWKDVRQKKQIIHIGKIRLMDEQTRAIGEAAIRSGEARSKRMDTDMRNWEARQSSQDRMHTNFIKTIREVENYQDASGKVELSSGYDHAWSRGDGSTFVMSNNPNFDPASAFQDQSWKEMKKVD